MGNNPSKGAVIRVEPIRSLEAIQRIKALLKEHPRNYCMFVIGINTALRGGELLSLTIGDGQKALVEKRIVIRERKTGNVRTIGLNSACLAAIERLIACRPAGPLDAPLFEGQRGPLSVQYLNRLIKTWCKAVKVGGGNFGSHTLRKTWGYHQRVTYRADLPVIMKAFGHSNQSITLRYLGIQPEEVQRLYENEI